MSARYIEQQNLTRIGSLGASVRYVKYSDFVTFCTFPFYASLLSRSRRHLSAAGKLFHTTGPGFSLCRQISP